jgi:acyl carrier protein
MGDMEAGKREIKLARVMGLILGCDVTSSTSREQNSSWDSLKHIQIIFAIEDEFGVQFEEDEIPRMNSFTALLECLERYDIK